MTKGAVTGAVRWPLMPDLTAPYHEYNMLKTASMLVVDRLLRLHLVYKKLTGVYTTTRMIYQHRARRDLQ